MARCHFCANEGTSTITVYTALTLPDRKLPFRAPLPHTYAVCQKHAKESAVAQAARNERMLQPVPAGKAFTLAFSDINTKESVSTYTEDEYRRAQPVTLTYHHQLSEGDIEAALAAIDAQQQPAADVALDRSEAKGTLTKQLGLIVIGAIVLILGGILLQTIEFIGVGILALLIAPLWYLWRRRDVSRKAGGSSPTDAVNRFYDEIIATETGATEHLFVASQVLAPAAQQQLQRAPQTVLSAWNQVRSDIREHLAKRTHPPVFADSIAPVKSLSQTTVQQTSPKVAFVTTTYAMVARTDTTNNGWIIVQFENVAIQAATERWHLLIGAPGRPVVSDGG